MDNLDAFGCFTDYLKFKSFQILNKRLSFQNSHKKKEIIKKNNEKSVQCVFIEIELIVG